MKKIIILDATNDFIKALGDGTSGFKNIVKTGIVPLLDVILVIMLIVSIVMAVGSHRNGESPSGKIILIIVLVVVIAVVNAIAITML
jgi:L-cystine uptake protein TcyP (sodium:dicarboxylate symporter family)